MQALLLALVASARAITDNYVDGQCSPAGENADVDNFPSKSEYGTQFTDTVGADYSLLWEVQYAKDYKIVKNSLTGDVHILHQCGADAPTNEELPAYAWDGATVEVPMTAVATTSTTYLPFIEMLNERRALKAYQSSFAYVSSPCFRKMFRDGQVVQNDAYGTAPLVDLETLGVQATFASQYGSDQYKFIQMTDINEQQPDAVLKTAEYVEYLGLYFNREKEATAAIAHIVDNYMCTKEAVSSVVAENAPVPVLWSQYFAGATCTDGSAGGWSVASANSWYAEIINDAGGRLVVVPDDVVAACESWGAPYLPTAQLMEVGADALVMISPGPFAPRLADGEVTNLDGLQAWDNGRVFDNQGPNGANDWFERRVVEPDAVLQDMALAFYPDDSPTATFSRKWLRNVRAGEPIGGVSDEDLDTACPDIDAPYEFPSTEMCAQLATPGPTDEGGSDAASRAGLAAAAAVAAALVF